MIMRTDPVAHLRNVNGSVLTILRIFHVDATFSVIFSGNRAVVRPPFNSGYSILVSVLWLMDDVYQLHTALSSLKHRTRKGPTTVVTTT